MTSIEEIKNVLHDWVDLVLNTDTILPASLDIKIERSHTSEGTNENKHIVIGYAPTEQKQNGLDSIELGVDTDYDFDKPETESTYSNDTHITDNKALVEIREVNGDGKLLAILKKTWTHHAVKSLFKSKSMALRGFEGGIMSVPFKVDNTYYEESMMTVNLGVMDGITFQQDFIASISGSFGVQNASGATIISGTFDTEQQ